MNPEELELERAFAEAEAQHKNMTCNPDECFFCGLEQRIDEDNQAEIRDRTAPYEHQGEGLSTSRAQARVVS